MPEERPPAIRLQRKGPCCPLCKEPFRETRYRLECPGCATAYHRACAREMGGCSTLGCSQRGRVPESQAGELLRGRNPYEEQRRALGEALAVFGAGGSGLAIVGGSMVWLSHGGSMAVLCPLLVPFVILFAFCVRGVLGRG